MALLLPAKAKLLLHTRNSFLILQRFQSTFTEDWRQLQSSPDMGRDDFSKWRKLDSRSLGITKSMISLPSWIVLKILRSSGFEAYLVGGCVRDLLLNKIPKDFDVITTAGLKQIKKKFHNALIVGRRFPICRVSIKGSIVEVSSFETVAEQSKRKEVCTSQMPARGTYGDLVRWKNCMQRDFTINCLFFDPFVNGIFDYTNAMADLRSLKLRTVIPAHLSFKEDSARILRGLRLAARLKFSFSKETEAAMHNLSSSIAGLEKMEGLDGIDPTSPIDQKNCVKRTCQPYHPKYTVGEREKLARIWLELNYMLSYGAAESSLLLLRKFKLLEIFLPCHALYLDKQAGEQSSLRSSMLMKLFSNLDQLITCDRPCDASLWVALLVYHLALVNNPQHAVVVLTLASFFYHGKWEESVKFAREHAQAACSYRPEILDSPDFLSDDEIAESIKQFVERVLNSLRLLVDAGCLRKAMASFPEFTCYGLVFVPRKTATRVEQVFKMLMNDVTSLKNRNSLEIDYCLLGEGSLREIRFVLGKIMMNTLVCRDAQEIEVVEEKIVELRNIQTSSMHARKGDTISKDGKKQIISLPNSQLLVDNASRSLENNIDDSVDKERTEIKQDTVEESKENVRLSNVCLTNDSSQGTVRKLMGKWQPISPIKKQKVSENEECEDSQHTRMQHVRAEKHHYSNDNLDSSAHGTTTEEVEKDKLGKGKKPGSHAKLSSLFK